MINGRTGMVASHKPCPDQCPGRERLAGPPGDDRTADGLTLTRDCRFARFVKVPRGEFVNLSCVSTGIKFDELGGDSRCESRRLRRTPTVDGGLLCRAGSAARSGETRRGVLQRATPDPCGSPRHTGYLEPPRLAAHPLYLPDGVADVDSVEEL